MIPWRWSLAVVPNQCERPGDPGQAMGILGIHLHVCVCVCCIYFWAVPLTFALCVILHFIHNLTCAPWLKPPMMKIISALSIEGFNVANRFVWKYWDYPDSGLDFILDAKNKSNIIVGGTEIGFLVIVFSGLDRLLKQRRVKKVFSDLQRPLREGRSVYNCDLTLHSLYKRTRLDPFCLLPLALALQLFFFRTQIRLGI